MKDNAKRQAAYKERMRKHGLTMVTLWVRPEHKGALRALATELNRHSEIRARINKHPNNVNTD